MRGQSGDEVPGVKSFVQNIIQYNIAWQAMDRVEDVVMDSVTRIKELDDAITDIRLVTGETHEGARQMINDYADLAAELGTTTDAVIDGELYCCL